MNKYTLQEDNIILEEIANHPNNLTEAFRRASIRIDRSVNGISYHWYAILSKKESACCFALVGKHTKNKNRKNIYCGASDNTKSVKRGLFNKIKRLLGWQK